MTTLVTGASGGFGRILCGHLRGRAGGGPVLGVSRRPAGEGDVACDLTDAAAVEALVERVRPRLVYHLASSFSNRYETDYAVNAGSTRLLLEAVANASPATRVVVMGSAAEYGVVRPEENPVPEDRTLRPVSVYGLTKAFQTQLAGYYAHARGVDVVVARMFNLLAPGLSERLFVGRVERLIRDYLSGDGAAIEVGNLDSRRDYVEAPEALAQVTAIAARGERGATYHVASGAAVAMREVLRRLLDASGVPPEAVREAVAGAGGRTGYDVPVIYADMRRTHELLRARA